jgi:hypothetical protein
LVPARKDFRRGEILPSTLIGITGVTTMKFNWTCPKGHKFFIPDGHDMKFCPRCDIDLIRPVAKSSDIILDTATKEKKK